MLRTYHLDAGPRYTLHARVGGGAVAEVWRATHESGAQVAIKRLRPELASDAVAAATLLREARATAKLHHPAVVQVLDLGRLDGLPFVAQELAAGPLPEGPAPDWATARAALLDVLGALAHAHARGVVHRDLKPSNLLRFEAAPRLRIGDFGLASLARTEADAHWSGTWGYAAPEQLLGERVDHSADLYALGCLATLLVSGRLPFAPLQGEALVDAHLSAAPGPLKPCLEIPEGLEAWIRRLLAKEPEDRWPGAAQAAAALIALDRPRAAQAPARRAKPLGVEVAALRVAGFVGRPEERAQLRARMGSPGHVLLRGPAGVGRSALARWASLDAHERGLATPLILPLDEARALDAVVGDALATLLDLNGLPDEDVEEELRLRLAQARQLSPRDLPALRGLLMQSVRPQGPLPPAHLGSLLRRTLQEVTAGGPTVVVLDGLEHAPDAVALIAPLLRAGALVVSTHTSRVAIPEAPPDLELALEPLPEQAMRALLSDVAGLEPVSALRLAERSGGNPHMASALLGVCLSQGLLEPRGGALCLTPSAVLRLPQDSGALLLERLDLLVSPAQRPSLGLAAALGPRVEARTWEQACAALELPLAALAPLLEADLLRPSPDGVRFTHPLLREALLARDPEATRGWHAACAEVVRDPIRRGRHLLSAGHIEAGAAQLLESNRFLIRGRHDLRALMTLDDLEGLALPPAQRAELARQRAWVAINRRAPDAVALAEQAVALAPGGVEGCRARVQLASALRHAGQREQAARVQAEASSLARSHGATALLREAMIGEATTLIRAGELALAGEQLDAAEAAGEADDPLLLNARAWLALKRGALPEAARSARAAAAHGDPGQRYTALTYVAEVQRLQGALEDCAETLDEAIQVAEAAGLLGSASVARASLGILAIAQGHPERARAPLEEAIERFMSGGRRALELISRAWLLSALEGPARRENLAAVQALAEELPLRDLELHEALRSAAERSPEDAELLLAMAERARP